MGVDLGTLVPAEETSLEALAGKRLAVDAYNTLYQFLSIIRQPDGTPLKDAEGRVTSHLSGLLYRSANVVEAGVQPIFVFDGKPHPLKLGTLRERSARKDQAQAAYEEALAEGDIERARTKAGQTSRLTREMVDQAKALIVALGLSYVDAPEEGEAQAAAMVRHGDADAVSSQDYDALLFGAPLLVRNLTVTGRRKLPRKQVWVDVVPETVTLRTVEQEAGLDRRGLVDMALFLGTDYNKGVKGIGPKKALKLVADHGGIEGVRRALDDGTIDPSSALHAQLSEGWDDLGDVAEARRIFLEPNVTDAPRVVRGRLDPEAVVALLCQEHGFQEARVRAAVERYANVVEQGKQRSLDAFF